MKPNYELLKDAYAIIGGIPDQLFDLYRIVTKRGENLECGTVACAMGWLSMHPDFAKKLNAIPSGEGSKDFDWIVDGRRERYYATAAAAAFGFSECDARSLFSMRGGSHFDRQMSLQDKCTDKAMFLKRVELFLKEHGQWHGLQTEAKPC